MSRPLQDWRCFPVSEPCSIPRPEKEHTSSAEDDTGGNHQPVAGPQTRCGEQHGGYEEQDPAETMG